MIYLAFLVFFLLSHHIYRAGIRGKEVPAWLEKGVTFVTAVLSLLAIVELGRWIVSRFVDQEDDLSGWLPGILVYPAALFLFLFVVLFALPKPLPRNVVEDPRLRDDPDEPEEPSD